MGADQSVNARFNESIRVFERGDENLSVDVFTTLYEENDVIGFSYSANTDHAQVVTNCVQNYKTLRHPCFLKFITVKESSGMTHVITEQGRPLSACKDAFTCWEIAVGLSKILQALQFLHTQTGVSHNNVSLESIYVTGDGEWKLARLDCARKLSDNSAEYLKLCQPLCDSSVYSTDNKKEANGCMRDMIGFAKVSEQFLERLSELDASLVNDFTDTIDLILSGDTSNMPSAEQVLALPIFHNELANILQFIEEITIKTFEEKEEFFKLLMGKLRRLPEEVVAKKLVHPLFKRFIIEDEFACAYVIPNLLTPRTSSNTSGILSVHLFKKYLSPVLSRLFTVREYRMRKLLLNHFSSYCACLDKTQLEKRIMPHILQGLHDNHEDIVSGSLTALACLIPILTPQVVIGTERRDIFLESKPLAIHANGTPSKGTDSSLMSTIKVPQHAKKTSKSSRAAHTKSNNNREIAQIPRSQLSHEATAVTGTSPRAKSVKGPVGDHNASAVTHSPEGPTSVRHDVYPEAAPNSSQSSVGEADDGWEDFDDIVPSPNPSMDIKVKNVSVDDGSSLKKPVKSEAVEDAVTTLKTSNIQRKPVNLVKKPVTINDDFSLLDIKANIKKVTPAEEVDFFSDMLPKIAINTTQSNNKTVAEPKSGSSKAPVNLAFAMSVDRQDGAAGGWDDSGESWDW